MSLSRRGQNKRLTYQLTNPACLLVQTNWLSHLMGDLVSLPSFFHWEMWFTDIHTYMYSWQCMLYIYHLHTASAWLTGHELKEQLYGWWSRWKHGCPEVLNDVWRSILDETGQLQTDVGLVQWLQIFLTLGKVREDYWRLLKITGESEGREILIKVLSWCSMKLQPPIFALQYCWSF